MVHRIQSDPRNKAARKQVEHLAAMEATGIGVHSQVFSGWPQGGKMRPKLAVTNQEVVILASEGGRLSLHDETTAQIGEASTETGKQGKGHQDLQRSSGFPLGQQKSREVRLMRVRLPPRHLN